MSTGLVIPRIAGRCSLTGACCAFLACLPVPALCETDVSAQRPDLTELSIEELMQVKVATVYGASKYEQKVTEAPAIVNIVTSEDIKRYGYRTLADLLRSVPGFYITYDRNYHFVGVRGLGRPGDYNARVLLLLNGYRINDNIYDQAYIGTDFILDMELIDRVEVIRGPGSSVYGGNAFLGVINVITKNGKELDATEASVEAASFATYKGRVSHGQRFGNGVDLLVSGSSYDSQGPRLFFPEFNDPATNNGFTDGTDYDRYHNLYSSIGFGDFNLQLVQNERTKGLATGQYDTVFNDPGSRTIDRRSYANLRYDRAFSESLHMTARLSYDTYGYDGIAVTAAGINQDETRSERWSGELKFVMQPWKRHRLLFGAEYTDNTRQDQRNFDVTPAYVLNLDDRRTSQVSGFYLQDEIAFSEELHLNAGARYDYYSVWGETTNPRVALIFHPRKDAALKLMYGQAFRPPNAYELYYNDGNFSVKAAPDLRPETIKTYELAWEQALEKNLRLTVSGYYYKIHNLINFITDPADGLFVFRNIAEVESRGIELGVEQRWQGGIEGRAGYTLQRSEDAQTAEILSNSPKHLLKLNLLWPVMRERLTVGTEAQYTSSRKTIAGNETNGFWLVNLTLLDRKLAKGTELSAGVYNLFDREYRDPVSSFLPEDSIKQDGRTYRLKLQYRF